MKISEAVIMDLLPLYQAGEASADTAALVEAYLKDNPGFARMVAERKATGSDVEILIPLTTGDEMSTLQKTRNLFRLRTILLALAILCTMIPFSIWDVSFDEVEGVNSLWNLSPESAIISAIIALGCWIGYIIINRRLSVTGI